MAATKSPKDSSNTFGITLDTAVKELQTHCEDAINFLASEMEGEWALAERYYNGETDLPIVENRSNVVKTEVRDAIRNTMPSIMRTLLHSNTPVIYKPSSIKHAPVVEQQGIYVTQVFYATGGYMVLYSAILEALKLKIGILKAFWEPEPSITHIKYTKVPFSTIEDLIADPLFTVEDFTQVGNEDDNSSSEVPLFDIEGYREHENGKICQEAVPNYEFFISRNVNSIEMAIRQGVHGHATIVTVDEALAMGIEYDDWESLDTEDPEQSDHTSSSAERRGYQKQDPNDPNTVDLLLYKFLLTEVYVSYDLKSTGRAQLYKFLLGGTAYKYLHHEEVEDSPFSLIIPIPIPHTVYGHSIAELTIKEQDTSTSLLRATVDNAHAVNNARIAADPNKTNFDDVINPALNAPIRKKSNDTLQIIQIPSTAQGNLGIMQYLDQDVQNKVGVTKAAQGLDPDAMQSTDKNAVMNTIMTSQGQTELMVRNIIETGIKPHFQKLLRLSIRHHAPIQMITMKGVNIPIDITMFDPDAVAVPNVGLGTASPMQKQMALSMIYKEQKEYMATLGPNNPFTSYSQMYNTLEDMLEANSIYNTQRYFNIVTPDAEKAWAQQQEQQAAAKQEAAKKAQPMDPSKAFMHVEDNRNITKKVEIAAIAAHRASELQFKAIDSAEDNDLARDKMVQERVIKLVEVKAQADEDAKIRKEQASNGSVSSKSSTGGQKST